ncbi:MAG: hypothetical protein COA86_15005 [Kangiella sp.]|nr:MAG: hypothetical protein COA86_15005 [Kangiella sp.]
MLHLILHFIIPLLIAFAFIDYFFVYFSSISKIKFPKLLLIWALMMLTMIIDLDHLLATPIYQIDRCSIGFHPLHRLLPILFYFFLCIPKKTRVFGVGLIIHMILDSIDCQINTGVWFV